MPPSDRDATVAQIAGRLTHRFPRVSASHLAATVGAEFDALADRPIQIYISNLVEHATRSRLLRESALAG